MANAAIMSCPRIPVGRKMLTATIAGSLLLGSLALGIPAASAAPLDGAAIADSYTTSSRPDFTQGTNTKMAVGENSGANRVGYIRLNTTSEVTNSTKITLTIHVTSGDSGNMRIYQGKDSWKETTLNAANAPSKGKLLKTVSLQGGAQTLKVELTGATSSAAGLDLVLERTDSGITRIGSRESAKKPSADFQRGAISNEELNVAPPPLLTVPELNTKPELTDSSCEVSAILVPSCGVWFGAAANPLGSESWDQALLNFEKTAGRDMDIAHYYKRGQSAMFPNATELKRQDQPGSNRILLYNWKPTGLTWKQVADGQADDYLKRLGAHMKANADKKFFVSLNAEMEDEVNTAAGSGQTAKDFANFFSHTVKVLRANGADNMVTVMNYTGIQKWGEKSWFEDLYPGDDVVDWIAQDPYAFGKPPVWMTDMEGMVNRTSNPSTWPGFYNWAAKNHPTKPQMLGEWGVDEDPAYPSFKTDFFATAADQLAGLPKLKALVYWDSTGTTPSGEELSVGETRVDSKSTSLNSFKNFASDGLLTKPRASYLD